MRISKYIKVDKNILIEYIYDDGNLIGESYKVGVNIKNSNYNYIANDVSGTLNTSLNTLFPIDLVNNTYGKFDTSLYSFLQVKDFASGFPIRHDIIKVHLPINYTFGEYLGFYLRVYAFDVTLRKTYDLSNFYYDITNLDQVGTEPNKDIMGYTNPPLFFQEKLWGKQISIEIPSLYALANQRTNGAIKDNTINYNLTSGVGFDLNSPIFLDFQFITSKSTVNSVTTYTLNTKNTITIPQSPEFEKIGVRVAESINGDFFEIYGVYNDNIGDFNDFMNRSVYNGNRYYVEYNITMYEQNIRGKSMKIVVTDDFLTKVEYRPIIKYSTTTAIIDIEMNLIDAVDMSQITRRASYGMLQDQVSKYSLQLMKINLTNANKPKIYNLKNSISTAPSNNQSTNNLVVETIKVPYPVLIDKYSIVAKSENSTVNNTTFFGIGKIMITIYPFDNVIKFILANQISEGKIDYMDLTNMGEIKLVIKNQNISTEATLFSESGEIDLSKGFLVFKLVSGKINDVRRIYDSGVNVFYIISTQQNTSSVIYSGLYKIYDSLDNVGELNQAQSIDQQNLVPGSDFPFAGNQDVLSSETAVVTRKTVTTIVSDTGSTASFVTITADTNQNIV